MRPTAIPSIGVFTLALCSAGAVSAWQARDVASAAQVAAPVGTSVLSGLVMSDEASPRPVRRATVKITGDGLPSTRLVGTDDDGRFVFDGLPAGSFTLSVAKPGYVEAFHGSRRPGRGPGVPVAVAAGERVDVAISILPGAVITGIITDAFGDPAPSVPVLAVEVRTAGSTALAPGRATTDDRGEYRIFGLPPGEYLVSALPRLQPIQAGPSRVVGEILMTTDEEARWASAAMSGRGASVGAGAAAIPPPGRPVAYTPVYYPGTTDPAAAATASLAAGEERAGVSMALRIVPVARIAGRLVDAGGQMVTLAVVSLYPKRSDAPSLADRLVSAGALVLPSATVTPPGFSIAGVPPGDYTLVARSGSGQRRATVSEATNERLWSVTNLSVTGDDQTNLTLRLMPGPTMSGSVVFEGLSLARPDDLSVLDLSLSSAGTQLGLASRATAVVDSDGGFRFRSLAPGSYSLRAVLPAATTGGGWVLKSAMLNGRDIADRPLAVESGTDELNDLVLTFTDRAAEISGRLIDAGGDPVTRYSILVVTTDRSLWVPNARRIRTVAPATDGSFRVGGLPAGEYAVAAVEDVEMANLADPAFLSRLLASAFTLTLAEGEEKRQDLRIGGRAWEGSN